MTKNPTKLEIVLYYCQIFLHLFLFFFYDRTEYQVLT